MSCRTALLLLAVAGLVVAPARAGGPDDPRPPLAFTPPEPGTYELHRIMRAPEGQVLTTEGRLEKLSDLTSGRITLLGFIYTSCTDPEGCPLAYQVFVQLKHALQAMPDVRDRVQLVTLSFDPERDSPSVMKRYAGSLLAKGDGVRWVFLTTPSVRELMPLVEGFGQDVRYSTDLSTGQAVRQLSHVLKVFLIDGAGYVREIYTSTFLYPQSILADVKTLLMEQPNAPPAARGRF